MDLHGCAAGVSKDVGDAFSFESFDEDVGAFAGLIWGETGGEMVVCGGGGGCCGGFGVGEDVGDVETVAFVGSGGYGEGETREESGVGRWCGG